MSKKKIVKGTYNLAVEISDLLDQFQKIADGEQKSLPKVRKGEKGKKIKATFNVLPETDRLLERLQSAVYPD